LSNVIVRITKLFFTSFSFLISSFNILYLPSSHIFVLSPTNSGRIHTVVLILQAEYFLIHERHTEHVVHQIIARVESSDIAFHSSRICPRIRRGKTVTESVYIIFSFIAIYWWHTCGKICTSRLSICIHILMSVYWILPRVCVVRQRFSAKALWLWKFDFAILPLRYTVRPILLLIVCLHVWFWTLFIVLPNTALFINL